MAYFSNSSDGANFEDECCTCKYGSEPCPIAAVQIGYNYEAHGNETATKILASLVSDKGTCTMKNVFAKDFRTDAKEQRLEF